MHYCLFVRLDDVTDTAHTQRSLYCSLIGRHPLKDSDLQIDTDLLSSLLPQWILIKWWKNALCSLQRIWHSRIDAMTRDDYNLSVFLSFCSVSKCSSEIQSWDIWRMAHGSWYLSRFIDVACFDEFTFFWEPDYPDEKPKGGQTFVRVIIRLKMKLLKKRKKVSNIYIKITAAKSLALM